MDPSLQADCREAAARICPKCELLTDKATAAMRHHASDLCTNLPLMEENPSEEARLGLRAKATASFAEAQAAWDAYRDHLIEHGFVPPPVRS